MSLKLKETNATQSRVPIQKSQSDFATLFLGLDCQQELRPADEASDIQFRDCLIDYTCCPERRCIKKLV